ncbi:hypothetical protein GQ457_HM001950 [Hibiscus cannabinus]
MLLLLLSRGFDNLLELDDKGDVSTRDNGSGLGRFSRLIQISAERRCAASSSELESPPSCLLAVALPLLLEGEVGVGRSKIVAVVGVGGGRKDRGVGGLMGSTGRGGWFEQQQQQQQMWMVVLVGQMIGQRKRPRQEIDKLRIYSMIWSDPASSDWAGAGGGDGACLLGVLPPVCSAGAAGVVAGLELRALLEMVVLSFPALSASKTGLAGGVGIAILIG